MLNKIDALFNLWKEHEGAGCQLLVIHKGETLVEKCYGYANIETGTPITPDTVFHVASISKPFTAMCVMILHERGLLNIDDDVRKYVPDLIAFSQPLTVRQMMNHVSGLPEHYGLLYLNGRSARDCLMQDELCRLIARQKELNFEPGEKFMYSNPNYVFLGTIVERVSGMNLAEFAKKNIFEPLGMDHSLIRLDPLMVIPNSATSYLDNGYFYRKGIVNFGIYGGTNLSSNCRDLAKYIGQYKEPTLISEQTLEDVALKIPQLPEGRSTCYAGGVRINLLEGHRYIHHGGVNAGFRTVMAIYPEDELIIVALANTHNIPIETAARDVARIVLGLPERKLRNLDAYTAETFDISQIEGFYCAEGMGSCYELQVKDGQVYLGDGDDVKLTHIGKNLFKQGRRNITFAFGKTVAVNDENVIRVLRKLTQTTALDGYAGSYFAKPVNGHFDVVQEGGKLWLDHLRHGRKELHWLEGDVFCYVVNGGMRKLEFVRDDKGAVVGFDYRSPQVYHMLYKKTV